MSTAIIEDLAHLDFDHKPACERCEVLAVVLVIKPCCERESMYLCGDCRLRFREFTIKCLRDSLPSHPHCEHCGACRRSINDVMREVWL